MKAKVKGVPKMLPGMTKVAMKKHMSSGEEKAEKAMGYKKGGKVSKKGC